MFGCPRRWGGWIWLCISRGLSTNLQAMLSASQGGHAKLALHPWNSRPPVGLGSLRGWDRAARYIRKASWRSGARPCGTHLVHLFHLSILAWKSNNLRLAVAHCRSPECASGHAISDQSCQFQWSLAAISTQRWYRRRCRQTNGRFPLDGSFEFPFSQIRSFCFSLSAMGCEFLPSSLGTCGGCQIDPLSTGRGTQDGSQRCASSKRQ